MENISERDLRCLLKLGHLRVGQALDRLGQDVVRDLAANAHLQTVSEGDILETVGRVGQKIGYLLDGALAMVKHVPDGGVHIVGLLLPTDLFGRLTRDEAPHQLVVIARSRILFFDRDAFDAMMFAHPDLERLFMVSILDELDAARDWILMLNGTSVMERVAAFLTMLARREEAYRIAAPISHIRVKLPISRKHVANALAIRPESLSRALHALSDLGVVRIVDPATFDIPDLKALVDASGQDPAPGENGFDKR